MRIESELVIIRHISLHERKEARDSISDTKLWSASLFYVVLFKEYHFSYVYGGFYCFAFRVINDIP